MQQALINASPEELIQSGRPEDAAMVLGCRLQQTESSDTWNDWATAELACGRSVRAELGYRRALLLDPLNHMAAVNLTALLLLYGRLEESLSILEPHAESITAEEKTTLKDLTARCGSECAVQVPDPVALAEAFLAIISLIPNDDPTMPDYMRKANRQSTFDTSYYVNACSDLLAQLPAEAHNAILDRIKSTPVRDHRHVLVLVRQLMKVGDHAVAVGVLRRILELRPLDLFAQHLLMQCELAVMPADAREKHPWANLDQYLSASFCDRPWREMQLIHDGSVHMCCEAFLPSPIGNVHQKSAEAIWNGPEAQAIRASILDGSFRYCSRFHCPRISCRDLPPRKVAAQLIAGDPKCLPKVRAVGSSYLRPISAVRAECEEAIEAPVQPICMHGPKDVVLAHDSVCNLACPMCRRDFILSRTTEEPELSDKFIALLPGAETLRLNAVGEVLASRKGRAFLKRLTREQYPNLRFVLMTNGQLCDRKAFDEFDLWGRLSDISISVDATNEKTYQLLRRGGDFNRLLKNLEFLDNLRQTQGETFTLSFFFVVSSRNYKEVPEFVRLARRFHANLVAFYSIRNGGGDSPQEFTNINVENPDHPEHAEFLKVLASEELQDPCVDMANLGYLRSSLPIRA